MATSVILPKQGWSMDEAKFVQWLKEAGQSVSAGEPLFSVETDKAVEDVEALDSGILYVLPNGPREGTTIKIGDVIGYLLAPGESPPTSATPTQTVAPATPPATAAQAASAKAVPIQSAPTMPADVAPEPSEPAGVRAPVSPRAARRAVTEGVDLRSVAGTGRGGRIRESDILAAVGRSPVVTGPPGHQIPVRTLRRTIAQRMVHSKTVTAPVTLTTRADATALVKLRASLKSAVRAGELAPSYNDLIMKLVADALQQHLALNARWEGDHIVHPDTINIGLAVDTEDGLLVPVVRNVPALSLRELARRTADLVSRARQRKASLDELTGGTFTLTNLGAAGVDAFTPIINHPECAVLGIGRITAEPVVVKDAVAIGDRVWLSLTFDHRIVDGGPAARFLETLRVAIENPPARLTE